MRIAVLGSTSRTGLLLLGEAARRGHQVVAFTRRPDRLTCRPGVAAVLGADVRNRHAMRDALAGTDEVISLLPGGTRQDPRLATEVANAVAAAMTEVGIRRLVVVSAYPIVGDRPRFVVWLLRRVLAVPYADVAEAERVVQSSGLDWTIARLNRLVDKPARGDPVLSRDLLARPKAISRAAAAAILLDLAQANDHAKAAVNISGSSR